MTTNQRLFPTYQGNGKTIIVGDSQTSLLPIFFLREGGCLYTGYELIYFITFQNRSINSEFVFYQVLIYMNKTLSSYLQELKNKGIVQLGNPESGWGR